MRHMHARAMAKPLSGFRTCERVRRTPKSECVAGVSMARAARPIANSVGDQIVVEGPRAMVRHLGRNIASIGLLNNVEIAKASARLGS